MPYRVVETNGRFVVMDEDGNTLTRSTVRATAERICRHYNDPQATLEYPVRVDPESLVRRQIRAENREDLARLAMERKRELLDGNLSVTKTISPAELERLKLSTRGESVR